ncbi:MAG: diguanylate cyclase [Firmicutes bacterium]|nr:diguanylate cyclase [Bacillota bacterium]
MNLKNSRNFNTHNLIIPLILGLFIFTICNGLNSVILYTPYLIVLHGIFEIASISMGFITFFIAWYGTAPQIGPRIIAISLAVLSATILELVHMLFYAGLPDMNSVGEHIWLTAWVFSHLIWSFGLLFAIKLPTNGNSSNSTLLSNRTLFYGTLVATTGLVANIILNYNLWPNVTAYYYNQPIAVYAQYVVCVVDLLALFILHRQNTDNAGKLLQVALLFVALADFSFSLGFHTAFSLNIAGHFFKLLADFFVLRSLYILVVRQPYDEIIQLNEKMEQLAENNAKLYQESEQQQDLFEDTLAKVGMIISSQLNVNETLEAIADMVADLMDVRQSIIALFNKDRSALKVVIAYGINTPPDQIPLKCSLAGQACADKSVQYTDDITLQPDIFRPQLIFSSIRSIICAPLVNDHEIIGVIEAYSSEKGAFTKRDALLLKALGHHAGAAISSAELFEQTKIRLSEEQYLYQIAQFSAATIDTDTIMESSTSHAVKALNADIGVGFLVTDEKKCTLTYKTSVGLNSKPASFELASYPKLVDLVTLLSPSVTTAEAFPPLNDNYPDATSAPIMIMPLLVDHRLLGLIIIGWRRFISPEQLERDSFAALMAQQIALGLEKAHLYNQVKAMALSDGLTGLANRRNFDMFLNTELRRAVTLKRPLSLIMLDLDKFKNYNDTYGHPIGDKLLSQIGKILQQAVRSIDFPARYGGEEFSVILPECNSADASAIAEKIRYKVESSEFPDNFGTFTARITASLGVVTYNPADGSPLPDIAQLVAMADDALYRAKKQGRNLVCTASEI